MAKTLIQVSEETWTELNKRKGMGETFEDVLRRMILEFPEVKK